MMRLMLLAAGAAMLLSSVAVSAQTGGNKMDDKHPVVVMETNQGTIEITLDAEKAPASVRNFLSYVNEAYYDSTIFHRVISGFMIQGGGYTLNMASKKTKPPVRNEADNGLKNKRGTVAMARTNIVDSATSQFFINHADNAFLDHRDKTQQGYGYAVFGQVTSGMDVVDKIAAIPTGAQDVPMRPAVILSIRLKK